MAPNSSLLRRNRSCINGSIAHIYEYFYHGDLSSDILITVDVYLSVHSDYHDRRGPAPTPFDTISSCIGGASAPAKCFELWGCFNSTFTNLDLRNSIFCHSDDWPNLWTILENTEFVSDLIQMTPLTEVTGIFAQLKLKAVDDLDQFHLILILK